MQALAVPLAFYSRPVCVVIALFWLVYRATQVLHKPLDELAALLGFDIPSTPSIDLASIKADGAIVHWTLPERQRQKNSLKFEIHLNGTVIDNISVHESAVTITGLQPGSFYLVRVALINSLEFGSKSTPVRFRTKSASSADFFVSTTEGHDTEHDGSNETVPRCRPFRGLKDVAPASPLSTPMIKEASTGLAPRRTITGRRPSPATLGLHDKQDPLVDETEPPEGSETIQQLTERLDAIRRETDEAERQAKDEEEEELRMKEELIRERDELKAEAMEKERASRNLKREVNTLERQNTAAQNERSKHERMLQQKRQERQKLKGDVVRWKKEAEEMRAIVELIKEDKIKHLESAAQAKEQLRVKHEEEATKARALDDAVREKTADIRKLEHALKDSTPDGSDPEPTLVQQFQNEAEEDRQWTARRHALQQQYALAVNRLDSAKRFHDEQLRYLESIRAQNRRNDEFSQQYASPSPTQERLPRRGDSQRSRHASNRHSLTDSPRLVSFPPVSQSPFASTTAGPVAPQAFSSAPYLNIHNGMTIPGPTNDVSMSEEDKEKLTGGAALSPGAGADLLPADLFSSDGDSRIDTGFVRPLPGLGALPGLGGILAAPPAPPVMDHPGPGPASPASVSSRSPSVFVSPQSSSHNLHIGSPENIIDADRRSIRSTRSNRATSGGGTGSRFSGMFGIKHRSKMMSDGGPPLAKSNSMPRPDPALFGLDAATRKRNSSISGTGFGTPEDEPSDPTADIPAPGPSRKAFGLFSREKSGGWPTSFSAFGRKPTSPRPGSTHSNELPRPSMDNSRWGVDTWPSSDAASGARGSPLAFGPGWNLPGAQGQRMYGSRHPSRRPSVQYAASGPPEDILEDEDSDAIDISHTPNLDPIGTKPSVSSKPEQQADLAARLNPNAKDFKSFFSSMKLTKSKDHTPANTSQSIDTGIKGLAFGSHPVPSSPAAANLPHLINPDSNDTDSPPHSRKSREARSMTETESSLAESGRNSMDLSRIPSFSNASSDLPPATPPPHPGPGASSKESLMSKLARKSSSSKFSLPNWRQQREKAAASSTSTGMLHAAEDDEDTSLNISTGSLRDSQRSVEVASRESKDGGVRGSGRSWGSVLKLTKGGAKRGNETPSVSGLSFMSGTEDGDEGLDEEGVEKV